MSYFAETKTRFRRQTVHGKRICPGGTTYWKSSCFAPLLKCRQATRSCYKWASCKDHPYIEHSNKNTGGNRWMIVRVIADGCREFHEFVVSAGCCGYYC